MLVHLCLLVVLVPALLVSGRPCDGPHTTHKVHHTHNPHTTRSHHPSHTTLHVHTTRSPARPPPTASPSRPTPTVGPGQPPSSSPQGGQAYGQCNTGPVQCCNSVEPAGSPSAAPLLGSLGVLPRDLNTPIGLTCTPLAGLGSNANWSVAVIVFDHSPC